MFAFNYGVPHIYSVAHRNRCQPLSTFVVHSSAQAYYFHGNTSLLLIIEADAATLFGVRVWSTVATTLASMCRVTAICAPTPWPRLAFWDYKMMIHWLLNTLSGDMYPSIYKNVTHNSATDVKILSLVGSVPSQRHGIVEMLRTLGSYYKWKSPICPKLVM